MLKNFAVAMDDVIIVIGVGVFIDIIVFFSRMVHYTAAVMRPWF